MTTHHDLLLFGGSGKTGLQLIHHAKAQGKNVACLLRPGRDSGPLDELGVTVIRGDAFELADCERALQQASPRAIVSLLGGKDASGRRVDATGNINVINAVQRHQPHARFILFTSMGCDEQYDYLPPAVQQALHDALMAKTQAEHHLRQTTLNWCIVRPGGLNDSTGQGQYQRVPAPMPGTATYISRSDAALATLDLLADTRQHNIAWTILGTS